MQAAQLLRQGCKRFLASLVSTPADGLRLEDIKVVRVFRDVFPDDISGLPPDREVEFTIDLVPRTASISKAPYCMAPIELKELSRTNYMSY